VADRDVVKRGPDPLALVAGILTIGVAVVAFVGQVPPIDPRWVLAAAAALVGLLLLRSSVTASRRRR
jgi:hypothetical protein